MKCIHRFRLCHAAAGRSGGARSARAPRGRGPRACASMDLVAAGGPIVQIQGVAITSSPSRLLLQPHGWTLGRP